MVSSFVDNKPCFAFVSNTEFYTVVDQLNKILDVLGLYYRLLSMVHSHKS